MAKAKAKRAKARPDLFPAGNAVVGDRVYFWRIGQLDQEPRLGRVVEVGLRNEHRCFLNIRVRPEQGRPFICSPIGHRGLGNRDDYPILEPAPARLRRENVQVWRWFYTPRGKPRYQVRVARCAANTCAPHYRLICTACWGEIWRKITSIESAELLIGQSGGKTAFYEGKPAIEDSDSRLVCDCAAGPDPDFVKSTEVIAIEEYR